MFVEKVVVRKHLNHHAIFASIDRNGVFVNAEFIMGICALFLLQLCSKEGFFSSLIALFSS